MVRSWHRVYPCAEEGGGGTCTKQIKKVVCFVALQVLYFDMDTISLTLCIAGCVSRHILGDPAGPAKLHLTKKVNKSQQTGFVTHLQHLLPVQSDEVFIQLISPSTLPPGLLVLGQKACQVDVSILQHHVDGAFCLYNLQQ